MRLLFKNMIYNFNLKEKATKNLKGKWIDVCLTVFIFSLITLISGVIYNLVTEGLRWEIALIEEQMLVAIEKEETLPLYYELFEKYTALLGKLSIYSLITLCGTIIFNAFSMTIASIYMIVANGGEYKIKDLKTRIKNIKDSVLLNLLITVKLIPWFLLFIIPGIVKSFSYALANYIKIEKPDIKYTQAIKESERLMNGNKRNLFIFYLSFIGWYFLTMIIQSVVTTIIPAIGLWTILVQFIVVAVNVPLQVYVGVSTVNFYNAIKNQRRYYEQYNYQRNYTQQSEVFSDFSDKSEPFENFGKETKNTTDTKDPFSDF